MDTRVEWVDTDAAGHHHNSAVMRRVEAAESELMRRAGLPEYFPAAPRVHHSVDFHSKVVFGQWMRTRLWIERIGTTSVTFGFEVLGNSAEASHSGTDGWARVASGRFVTAHVACGDTTSSPWPADWLDALLPYCRSE